MFHLCLLQIENRTAPCPLFSACFAPPESIGCTSPSRPSHLLLTAIDTYRSFSDSLSNNCLPSVTSSFVNEGNIWRTSAKNDPRPKFPHHAPS
jgi:hypothetical protein